MQTKMGALVSGASCPNSGCTSGSEHGECPGLIQDLVHKMSMISWIEDISLSLKSRLKKYKQCSKDKKY